MSFFCHRTNIAQRAWNINDVRSLKSIHFHYSFQFFIIHLGLRSPTWLIFKIKISARTEILKSSTYYAFISYILAKNKPFLHRIIMKNGLESVRSIGFYIFDFPIVSNIPNNCYIWLIIRYYVEYNLYIRKTISVCAFYTCVWNVYKKKVVERNVL